jgi:CheY-like chemotaxis protein
MAVELAGRAAATPTILCIDDNRAGLAIRKLLLEHQGYSVLTAEDGVSGLSLLERNPVDAVVLDYRMPGMDGDAVAQIIRKEHPGLPIVILPVIPKTWRYWRMLSSLRVSLFKIS